MSSPAKARNLILSFATSARAADIRRFISSAREACSPGTTDIVLFVEPAPLPFAAFAHEHDVRLVPVVTYWKAVSADLKLKVAYRAAMRTLQVIERGEVWRTLVQHWVHPQAGRYLFYEDFVRANPQYGRVMLSDSRDVAFQADPFEHVDDDSKLHVFEQDPSIRFGGDNGDTKWIPRVYGTEILGTLDGKQTLCSGTTFATVSMMLKYLAAMAAEVLAHRTVPLDQAMHNKLIYTDWPAEHTEFHTNAAGPVLTMHDVAETNYQLVDDRLYVGDRLVPVLHQYDRIAAVKQAVHRRYGNR